MICLRSFLICPDRKGGMDMARSSNQKLKLLHIIDYLLRNFDEDHPVTTAQIIQHLEQNGISAERKSIYDDIESLQLFGLAINRVVSGRSSGYYIASRIFELPERKLLVDSVQSSKFITHKKNASLIKKSKSWPASTRHSFSAARCLSKTGSRP